MTVSPKPRALDWFVLATAGLHETQIRVLETLAERGAVEGARGGVSLSPGALAAELGVPLGSVAYHMRELVKKDLIVLVRAEPVRGALQHFYALSARVVLSARQQSLRALSRSASKLAGAEEPLTADLLARMFHETYERRAPEFGYKTREASAVPWDEVPEDNKKLMRAVCAELLAGVAGA